MASLRIRYSVQELEAKFNAGDRAPLENVIRAFRGIMDKGPEDPDSFFNLAGFHGEPFRGPGELDPAHWGGYCNHGNILFPTWHRAYLLRFEDALRKIPNCENVTLPFWDEMFSRHEAVGSRVIPEIITTPQFLLDNKLVDNPLYSYRLQQELLQQVAGSDGRYSKHVGYETVRYPLSGLVGTDADKEATAFHNSSYADPAKNTEILNGNVSNWLEGTVQITPDPEGSRMPDTYSVAARFQLCLEAPNYTVFSNTTSMNQWIKDKGLEPDSHYVVSLESPHNAIHLAVGGFYQAGEYNANNIRGANGDMGDNETAGFDPIFFLHHAFIDYTFWTWQKRNHLTTAGSLSIIPGYPGSISDVGLPNIPPETTLTMQTPLYPFKKDNGVEYTSDDVTDIAALGYNYGHGSLDQYSAPNARLGDPNTAPVVGYKRIHNIDRAQYAGSFVIRTLATGHDGKEVEIGREPILSRWSVTGCKNCQSHLDTESLVPLDSELLKLLRGNGKNADIKYRVVIQAHENGAFKGAPQDGQREGGEPIIDDL